MKFTSFLLFLISFSVTAQVNETEENLIRKEVLHLVNEYRISKRKTPLDEDGQLNSVAKLQSDYNSKNNSLSHYQKKQQLKTVKERIFYIKHQNYSAYGENCNMYQQQNRSFSEDDLKVIAYALFELWKNSKGHRENMLNSNFYFTGFAVTYNEKNSCFFGTQVFTSKN
ncbi:MAG: CAP domain-containing protein [Flavobacteriia bacterium]|nr:CAP domain-containing protein [Flavobacteriia bacterium]OJX37588.1 MAG: hypothetical protein BGO87_10960 [Flavobacteriia bacterium 40-80]